VVRFAAKIHTLIVNQLRRNNSNIDSYNIVSACEKDRGCFIVELKGNFRGFLYTTPNVSKKDSIFVECRNFKVKILT